MATNREWIFKTTAHRETDRVPYDFMFSPPALRAVENYYGGGQIEERLNFPMRMGAPKLIKPLYADPEEFGESVDDEFGVAWSTNRIDRGSPIGHPLKGPDLSGYEFPDAVVSYRFEDLGQWCNENSKHFTVI